MSTTTTTEPTSAPAPASEPAAGAAPPEKGSGPTFEAIAVISLIVAFAAVVVSVFAMGLAARSIDEHRAIAEGGGGGGATAVSLTEFAISPGPISAPAGAALTVTNDGTTTHDLTVEGEDVATATLNAGDSEDLDVSGLAAGTYVVFCSIPGHRDSGMETELTLG